MRTSCSFLLAASLLALACPAPGGDTTGTTAGTSSATTGLTTGLTSGTGSGGVTEGSISAGATGDTTSTSGETSTAGTTSESSGTTSGTTSGTSSGTSGTSGTSGAPPADGCAADADCKLHDDCCTCAGVPADEPVMNCPQECKQSKCSEYGVDQAVCRLGVCTTERLSCDANKVLCDALPPMCPDGMLPETSPACWTGKCVPAALCDVVPDCALCPEGTMCVDKIAFGPQGWPTCEPIPPACAGEVTCACVEDLVCVDGFPACSVMGTHVLCECPNC